jgi:hypothetical protein
VRKRAAGALGSAAARLGRALRDAPPRAVLATAWLVLFVYAYPGQMTTDSFDHLAEARAGVYTDSHPPTMSLLWGLVEHVVAGGVGMLIAQSTAFLLGLYAVLRHTLAPRGAAWAAALVFLFPPVLLPFAAIWKDGLMAGFLMLGIAGLLASRRRGLLAGIAGLAALALATAVRYNAFAATFPLVVLLFELRPGMPWLRRHAIAAVAWLAVTLSAFGLNAAITDKQMHLWHSSLALFDIVGTLAHLDRDLPDAELDRTFAGTGLLFHDDIHARARAAFNPRDFLPIITDERRRLWDLPAYGTEVVPEPTRTAIARAWQDVVTAHPGAYVRYRLTVMAEVLCLFHDRPAGVVPRRDFKVVEFAWAQAIPTSVSPVQHRLTYWMSSLWKVAPIFVPWMYVLLAIIVGGIAIARGSRDVVALCASGLAMEATLALLAVSPDYRYSHWLVVSTCLAIVIAVVRRARASAGLAPASSNPNLRATT